MSDFVIENGILKKYTGSGGDVVIPDGVTAIDRWAFYVKCGPTRITLPDSVTEIRGRAFYSCSSLENIAIPNSVKSIGEGAFCCCSRLTDITLPDSITVINDETFASCDRLTGITIPDSVTKIGARAFYSCSSLSCITIPNSVKDIGVAAFSGCSSLARITLPDGVTHIDSAVFNGCSNLTEISVDPANHCYSDIDGILMNYDQSELIKFPEGKHGPVTLPDNVSSIAEYAFAGCTSLTRIPLHDGVESIGYAAFTHCTGLTELTLPDSVHSLGGHAFSGCTSLKNVALPNSLTQLHEEMFSGCTNLTNITLPDSVTEIDTYAFSGCTGLTGITLPDSLTWIGEETFKNCSSLSDITLPDSLTEIAEEAFFGCSKLGRVSLNHKIKISSTAFDSDSQVWFELPFSFPDSEIRDRSVLQFCSRSLQGEASPEHEKLWGKYIRGQKKRLYDLALREDSLLQYMLRKEIIAEDDVDGLIDRASISAKSALLEYAEKHVTAEHHMKKQERELETAFTGVYTAAQAQKEWSYENVGDTTIRIIGYKGTQQDVFFPVRIGKRKIIAIGEYAFSPKMPRIRAAVRDARQQICSITVPEGVKMIGKGAFEGCTGLTSLTVPGSVKKIGKDAFHDCGSLTVYAPAGSYAEAYAREHDIPFEAE